MKQTAMYIGELELQGMPITVKFIFDYYPEVQGCVTAIPENCEECEPERVEIYDAFVDLGETWAAAHWITQILGAVLEDFILDSKNHWKILETY